MKKNCIYENSFGVKVKIIKIYSSSEIIDFKYLDENSNVENKTFTKFHYELKDFKEVK